MAELPSGTVTFLFTGLEGSTRLWEEHPDAMRATLARHDTILRDAVESHGGSVVAQDGKTVALDSPATREMLTYAIELYNKAMTNEVLSWDDTGNNLLLASGRGAWIQNPISALRTIEHDSPDLANKIFISNTPAGPKGRMTSVTGNSWAIANWAGSVPAARRSCSTTTRFCRRRSKPALATTSPC